MTRPNRPNPSPNRAPSRRPIALAALALLAAASASLMAAPVVNLPTATLAADGVTRAFDVAVAGSAGEAVVGYDLFFTIAPRAGAVGTLVLSGDFAAAPAAAGVFGSADPAQSDQGGTYYAGYALASGGATLSGSAPNLLALRLSAAPGTLGTFDLLVGPGTAIYADDQLNGVPGATFAAGAVTVTAVPEPAAIAGVAVATLLFGRRRRR